MYQNIELVICYEYYTCCGPLLFCMNRGISRKGKRVIRNCFWEIGGYRAWTDDAIITRPIFLKEELWYACLEKQFEVIELIILKRKILTLEAVVRRCSSKLVLLKISVIFTGKHLWWSSFSIKLIKKRFQHRCFPVKFPKFLRTPHFTEQLRWVLLQHLWNTLNNADLIGLSLVGIRNLKITKNRKEKVHRIRKAFMIKYVWVLHLSLDKKW